jgi:pyruvate kinase
LPGPKLRTGAIEPGPRVLKWKPRRDVEGRVVSPARVWLTPAEAPVAAPAKTVELRLPRRFLDEVEEGMAITAVDLRGRERSLVVVERDGDSWWAESDRTAYIGPESEITLHRRDGKLRRANPVDAPAVQLGITLRVGDELLITRDARPGRPAIERGHAPAPAQLPCTLVEALEGVQPGHAIWLDDGKIGGVVEAVDERGLRVRITHALPTGSVIKADKGINLPDSPLPIPALAARDLEALAVAAEHADSVALSFARSAKDVEALQEALARLSKRTLGIVLKIETKRGFEQLPGMLLAAMRTPPVGVMIARGDLAVECGYERLAEVQEELLWVCEAAHVPVVWATQVLESLAKGGMPSRAEITDAAMGERAECVMLNKGPYIDDAVRVLDDILRRMEAHQSKKTAMLRPLRSLAFE